MTIVHRSGSTLYAGEPVRALLFDLDGTLMDTADGIAAALNQALAQAGLGQLPATQVRRMIGKGAPKLVRNACDALGAAAQGADQNAIVADYFRIYGDMCAQPGAAVLYPGAAQALATLSARALGVVTNKQRDMSVELLRQAGVAERFGVVVGGDTCAQRKPDPEPLQYACKRLQCEPSSTLMIGDSINDVMAARAAGMRVVCVTYGYNEGADPRDLACDAWVDSLAELPELLAGN